MGAQDEVPDADPSLHLEALKDKDAQVRLRAVRAMAKATVQVVEEMQRMHKEQAEAARSTERWNVLSERLTRLTGPGKQIIADALWDTDPDVIEGVTRVIGALGSWGAGWVPDLVEAWEQESILVRRGIMWAIARTGRTTPQTRRCIVQALRTRDDHLAQNALHAVRKLGGDAVDMLPMFVAYVGAKNAGVAENAGWAIEAVIKDIGKRIRYYETTAWEQGDLTAPDALRILKGHEDRAWELVRKPLLDAIATAHPAVASAAACALTSFGPRAVDAVPVLLKAWDRKHPGLRRYVIRALSMVKELPDEVIPYLIVALSSDNPLMHQDALWAAHFMGPRAIKLLPFVRQKLTDDRRADVPVNAVHAIREMGPLAAKAIPDLLAWRKRSGRTDLVDRALANMGAPGRFALSRLASEQRGRIGPGKAIEDDRKPFPASELSWEGLIAARGDEDDGYTIVSLRFLQFQEMVDDVADAIEDWVKDHGGATAIPVSALEARDADGRPLRLVHVWLVGQDGANLTVDLVNRGLLETRMLDTVAPEKLLVSDDEYIAFLTEMEAAERRAIAAERGLYGTDERKHARMYEAAKKLMAEGQWEEAAAELEALLKKYQDAAEIHLERARCMEELGRDEDALSHYDAVLRIRGERESFAFWRAPTGPPRHISVELARARCTQRVTGTEAAEKWLRSRSGDEDDPVGPWLVGQWRVSQRQPKLAEKPFREALSRLMKRDGFQFDEDNDRLVLDEATRKKDAEGLFTLWRYLHDLATACESAGNDEDAWLQATRLISVIRQSARKGGRRHLAAVFQPRIIRARIATRRGHWDVATSELELARDALNNTGGEDWDRWSAEVEAAARELRLRRR